MKNYIKHLFDKFKTRKINNKLNNKIMNKQEAQNRLTSIEKEVKELKKIINQPDYDWRDITSYEKACEVLGVNPYALPDTSNMLEEFAKPIIIQYKLFIIFKAINQGWTPDWYNKSQAKYYPWFTVMSNGSSFSLSYDGYYYRYGNSTVGSRLSTDSEDKAKFIGEKFIKYYTELFLYQ